MSSYDTLLPLVKDQAVNLSEKFFSATNLLLNIK
jgi:hypothetical protein